MIDVANENYLMIFADALLYLHAFYINDVEKKPLTNYFYLAETKIKEERFYVLLHR